MGRGSTSDTSGNRQRKMQSEQVVDVLTLPQLTMVTRLTAASLRSLAGLLNSLADTLGRLEVVAEKVEMVSDEVEVMTDQEDKVEDSNSCQKHPARFRCDTVCSEDSGIDLDWTQRVLYRIQNRQSLRKESIPCRSAVRTSSWIPTPGTVSLIRRQDSA